jgi:beta-glucanase (GH16 family)
MKLKNYIGLAATFLPLVATAQTTIDFETEEAYSALGVYDNWPASPFRTQKLQGNVAVVTNHLNEPDEDLSGAVANASEHILGIQRSRYGSNTFGARIDLKTPFSLSTTTKYVHVLMNKPVAGRVMLIGLGKRTERAAQSQETEQFWELSTTEVKPDKWCDAVFAIKGADGIDIYSLVVVPDCEPTHTLTADFAAYIDDIVIDDSPVARILYGDYPINFDAATTLSRSDRYTNNLTFSGSSDGTQTLNVGQQTSLLVYNEMKDHSFSARPGETIQMSSDYSPGTWMHSYVYLDVNQDGRFTTELDDNDAVTAASELLSFSCYNQKNSSGTSVSPGSAVTPPAFTIPSTLTPGFYTLRYKVDWNSIDPGGNTNSSNTVAANGGIIVDTRLNVHGETVTIRRTGGLNGDITTADGSDLTAVTAPFGKPFTIVAKPAPDFKLSYVSVRHGHNLEGDSIVHSTTQYEDVIYPAFAFKDNQLTLPAEIIDGDVIIEPYFINPGTGSSEAEGDYPLNFDEDQAVTRTDRRINKLTFSATQGGTSSITLTTTTSKKVYANMCHKQLSVVPGDVVVPTLSYTGSGLNGYLYIDLDQDGQFNTLLESNGQPNIIGELVSYNYYDGKNSRGETVSTDADQVSINVLPTFTVPAALNTGIYRARLKIDANSIDPAGQWGDDEDSSIVAQGGQVIDFLLNVHNVNHSLTVNTTNGSINGSATLGLAPTIPTFTALSLKGSPVAGGYSTDSITVRHGHNLDGPQYIHGNRQWNEYKRKYVSNSFSLPKDTIDGDVVITADFRPDGTENYKLVFSDEFDGENGSMPDASKWVRSPRYSATWNRFLSKTDEEHALTGFIEDGQFVARALPNPFTATDNVAMISGGIQTEGRFDFTYGKIEGRLLTNGYTGNFPAFWLMPTDGSDGWPYCGEIDIWEQINTENTSYHTIHSRWANSTSDGSLCQGQSSNPTKSGSRANVTTGNYHTFGLERTDKKLTWYVDGTQVFSYAKSDNQSDLDLGQWPFDKPFYIILNQSVGNGGWAAAPDTQHTYETRFDWVRVYEDVQLTGMSSVRQDEMDLFTAPGSLHIVAPYATKVTVVDLAGRTLFSQQVQGNHTLPLLHGVYVVNGRKVLVP